MYFIRNITVSSIRLCVGLAILLLAAGFPSYFVEVDKEAVVAAGAETSRSMDVSKIYFDSAKISTALLIANSIAEEDEISKQANVMYKEHPRWIPSGGDEPFFDAFYSTLSKDTRAIKNDKTLYSILSIGENRNKLLDFLKQSQSGLVKKIIELRKMTSTLLPPVFTSAGAPLDASLLTNALLAQTGDLNQKFLRDFSSTLDKMKGDTGEREKFEKYCLGVLVLIGNMDWTQVRSMYQYFDSTSQVYRFARIYKAAPNKELRNVFASAVLVGGYMDGCLNYLSDTSEQKWKDLSFSLLHGEGAVKFLVSQNKPIYRESIVAKQLSKISSLQKSYLGGLAVKYPATMMAFKIFLTLVGGYLFIRGFLRLFSRHRDTPKWFSPLALIRGFLQAAVVALIFFVLIEPEAFKIKLETQPSPDLRFAFTKLLNTIGEETMKFDTDTATLSAVGLFFTLQLTVYLLCIIRLSLIKRMKLSAKLKLKLLENEENLFDFGLYIGLAGSVMSLILLTFGIITASLMSAYSSTLFGILCTAAVKIIHVRKYRRQLIIEAENEEK